MLENRKTLDLTGSVNSTDPNSSANSPLIDYALNALERCWLPEFGRWSHIYHLDGRPHPNESLPRSDVFYTLNVLLGLARVPQVPATLNLSAIFQHNVRQLLTLPVRKYALGMAMWSAAELDLEIPEEIAKRIETVLANRANWRSLYAQDMGMLLTGAVAQAHRDPARWSAKADDLFSYVAAEYCRPSGLFADAPKGLRRRFASFASQVYLTLACYYYGRFKTDAGAIEIANRCSQKLIDLQGSNGEWPWFFDAVGGRVMDFYEIYSVHQYGMAPAFLELAETHGVSGARKALIKGFDWVLGANQLGSPMFEPTSGLSIRSQVRKGELNTNKWRAVRAATNSMLRRSGLVDANRLELRLECRSYELGWILWSFGKRSDLPQLTHHRIFSDFNRSAGGQRRETA